MLSGLWSSCHFWASLSSHCIHGYGDRESFTPHLLKKTLMNQTCSSGLTKVAILIKMTRILQILNKNDETPRLRPRKIGPITLRPAKFDQKILRTLLKRYNGQNQITGVPESKAHTLLPTPDIYCYELVRLIRRRSSFFRIHSTL